MPSINDPTVSIVLPTYNRAQYLAETIHNLFHQEYEDFELIVVDDGSTDETNTLLEEFEDPRLRTIRHPTNRGASASRNSGIQAARGEYVAFQDSDDRWKREKLRLQVELMEKRGPEVGLVYTGVEINGAGIREPSVIKPQKRGRVYKDQLWRDWITPTPSWLVRRSCFSTVGDFDERLPARQDYELSLRLAREYEFDFIKDVLVVMNTDVEGRISDEPSNRIRAHEMLMDTLREDHLKNYSKFTRRRILACQNFTLARYCQRHGDYASARTFFQKALTMNPFHVKAMIGYLLALAGMDIGTWYYRMMHA